jgi:hypothetical protein
LRCIKLFYVKLHSWSGGTPSNAAGLRLASSWAIRTGVRYVHDITYSRSLLPFLCPHRAYWEGNGAVAYGRMEAIPRVLPGHATHSRGPTLPPAAACSNHPRPPAHTRSSLETTREGLASPRQCRSSLWRSFSALAGRRGRNRPGGSGDHR